MFLGIILCIVVLYVLYRVIVAVATMPTTIPSYDDELDVEDYVEPEPVIVPVMPIVDAELYQGPFANPRIDTFGPLAEQPWLTPIEVVAPGPAPEPVTERTEAVNQMYPDSADTED